MYVPKGLSAKSIVLSKLNKTVLNLQNILFKPKIIYNVLIILRGIISIKF